MPSRFGLLKQARKFYRQLDYPSAVEILERDFFKDDPIAHYILGQIYDFATKRECNLPRDVRRSMKHYKRSSELGYCEASYEVAQNYEYGNGVKTSEKQAANYYRLAIEQGHIIAKYYLADLYIDHFPEHIKEAIELLEAIIQDGEYKGHACNKLGKLYLRGKGVEKDYEKARAWFEKGLDFGNASSCMELAHIYFYGLGVEKNLHTALAYVEQAGPEHIMYEEAREAIEKEMSAPRTLH